MTNSVLIYGSYGYTGALVAERAVEAGLSPTLAGRRAEPVERQATDLGLDRRVFSLEQPAIVADELDPFDAVLNCAGPFSKTADPLVSACLRAGTDYLDITGEIGVLEAIADRDREAVDADVTLLPAVGFDVVPTDCLAVYLAERLPSATELALALDGFRTYSSGTLKSIIEGLSRPGAVRERGELRTVPAAWRTRHIDFGRGPKSAVTVPWGDVATAQHSTGIGTVETYATVPEAAVGAVRRTRRLTPVLGSKPVQRGLKRLADAAVSGPTAEERAESSVRIWGQVEDDEGNRATARLRTPDPYSLTARTAVEAARRVADGEREHEVESGFRTPGGAFGADFVLSFPGVSRQDVREGTGVEVRTGGTAR